MIQKEQIQNIKVINIKITKKQAKMYMEDELKASKDYMKLYKETGIEELREMSMDEARHYQFWKNIYYNE